MDAESLLCRAQVTIDVFYICCDSERIIYIVYVDIIRSTSVLVAIRIGCSFWPLWTKCWYVYILKPWAQNCTFILVFISRSLFKDLTGFPFCIVVIVAAGGVGDILLIINGSRS